jgi:hypothetical protein
LRIRQWSAALRPATGWLAGSVVKLASPSTVAPASRKRLMCEASAKPVVVHLPGGTYSCPPPAAAIAATAFSNAAVLSAAAGSPP